MKSSNGYVVSKCRALFILIAFAGSLVAVGLLVYYLADRPYPAASNGSSSSAASTAGKTPSKVSDKNVRLPRAVLPRHYDVRLFPVLEKGNFTIPGRVSIDLECKEETDRIVLHSADIVVEPKSVRVRLSNGVEFILLHWLMEFAFQVMDRSTKKLLMVDGIDYDKEMEFLVVRLCPKHKVKLAKGTNYTLSMNFIGNLTDQLRGLYRSTYKEDGVDK